MNWVLCYYWIVMGLLPPALCSLYNPGVVFFHLFPQPSNAALKRMCVVVGGKFPLHGLLTLLGRESSCCEHLHKNGREKKLESIKCVKFLGPFGVCATSTVLIVSRLQQSLSFICSRHSSKRVVGVLCCSVDYRHLHPTPRHAAYPGTRTVLSLAHTVCPRVLCVSSYSRTCFCCDLPLVFCFGVST